MTLLTCATTVLAVVAVSMVWSARAAAADSQPSQEMINVPIQVVDEEGRPVVGAKVTPWALRCSQGHGSWRVDGFGASKPPKLTTDGDGRADVPYPRLANVAEQVATTEVTLSIDHQDFVHVSHESVDVPRTAEGAHVVTLKRGASIEIVPLMDGQRADAGGIHALWSGGRSWNKEAMPSVTEDGALVTPIMPAGTAQILLIRLDGERATHFSRLVEIELERGAKVREHVELRPAARIHGRLSDNVPRPVRNARLKANMLRAKSSRDSVKWFTWAPIAEDGTFVIDGWPADQAAQIIALCDGFIAESGTPPAVVACAPKDDPFQRPQVFLPDSYDEPIVLRMTPTVRCAIDTVNANGDPLKGAKVTSYPNVGWWNVGSQIYCHPLARAERVLVRRSYEESVDDAYPQPFCATTDANGRAFLELPGGSQDLYAESDGYELPIIRGRRDQGVQLVAGQEQYARLVMYPKGTEYLGEWDKLAGVLFGCKGKQCRRLLEDNDFRSSMAEVRVQLDAADDPTDPALLGGVYESVAKAFAKLGDEAEAAKWRRKAADQSAKAAPIAKPADSSEGR